VDIGLSYLIINSDTTPIRIKMLKKSPNAYDDIFSVIKDIFSYKRYFQL